MDSSFIVDSTGQVFSFGLNEDGQCGNEKYGIQWKPSPVKGDLSGVKIKEVSGSTDTIMALSEEGDVFIWGQTEYGQAVGATEKIQVNICLYKTAELRLLRVQYVLQSLNKCSFQFLSFSAQRFSKY